MARPSIATARLALFLGVLFAGGVCADQTLIGSGSTWNYNDSGSNLGTAWRGPAFDDSGWAAGPAQLGYGDGDEATVLSFGGNVAARHITYYFRRSFTVANPAVISALTLRVLRDDGCIVYLNGTEVLRSNLPSGTVSFSVLATTAISGAAESTWQQLGLDPAVLVAGTNTIAVELHQQSASSSDISLDVELLVTEAVQPRPSVTLLTPSDRNISNQTTVTFNAAASSPAGLASATLLVGGPPVTAVFTGPLQVRDAQLTASTPTTPAGNGISINIDGQTPHAHGLLAFPGLIGVGSDQVPASAVISSATLRLNCTNSGNVLALYRLTQNWDEDQATWNERRAGVPWASPGADGAGSNAGASLAANCTTTGQQFIELTPFVQSWSDGAANYGLVLTDTGTDGVDVSSSESSDSPVLTVVYHADQQVAATQPLTGQSSAVSLSATLPVGTHYWNVEVTDLNGERGSATSDFELTVDPTYPDAPVLVTPAAGAVGVSPTLPLAAWVSDPGGNPVTAQVALRKAAAPEFTIIAIPDTQHYSEAYPGIFTNQTEWIVNNQAARNIVFVTHEGDIVEHNSLASEWQAANISMSLLDGVVPYGMGPGNHDQPTTLYNQYFPYTRYEPEAWYGGHYQNLNDNNYELFSAGGLDFVIVHLAFCPPAGAVTWADGVLKTYPGRIGIMTTHGYLNESAQRSVPGCTSTQYLWDGLAVPNPNLHFMLSGHVHDESRRADTVNGHPVYQMLADYQDRPSGGEGWLRILRFVPAEDTVHVQTYSPWLNRFETDANSQFSLDFPMSTPFGDAGRVAVASGALAVLSPAGLEPFTEYEWQMTVTNDASKSRAGPVWRFMTGANVPPPDTDADGIADAVDNCRLVVNVDQRDTNSDGYGNLCDADLDNDGRVNFTDLSLFKGRFTTTDPDANLDGIGVVNFTDLAIFKLRFGRPPGPSGLVP